MYDQPRLKAYQAQAEWGSTPSGTLSRGSASTNKLTVQAFEEKNDHWNAAADNSKILRGKNRFQIFCQPCHGARGFGDGIIVSRGFEAPPSYHSDALHKVSDEFLFAVISQGLLKMPRFESRISRDDRYALVSYIRFLQKEVEDDDEKRGGPGGEK
ncbi:MAG: cytochrome c [Chitinophagaceae bacterium]|nr:cytochrome c [Oligoflexus sp.]